MLSDAKTWSSSTGQTFSGAPSPDRCQTPPSPSGELTEIEKLTILVRKIVERRNGLSSDDIPSPEEMKRGNEARLTGGVPFNHCLPKGRSIKHQIFHEDSATSPTEYSASETLGLSPGMNHNWLGVHRMRTLCSEPSGLIHGTWPRNRRGHVSTAENTDSTVTNHRNENLTDISVRDQSDLPSRHKHALSQMDIEHETSNSTSRKVTESQRPHIVEIQVTKRPRKTAVNTFQGTRSNFQTRNSINSPSSCSAPKYPPTEIADSELAQTRRHFGASLNVNTGLTTLTEDVAGDGQENRDLNNNSFSPYADVSTCREDRSRDPVSVSASLIITYPFVRRAHSIDNPYRRMICNPAVSSSSSTRSSLRRTMSEESRRKADGKTCKHGPAGSTCIPVSPLVHTKPPIHRSNSCLAAFGHTCLPISKSPTKVNASNHGRSWYEGV